MGMSNCAKCWDTPCTCGYNYRNMNIKARVELVSVILGVAEKDILDNLGNIIPTDHPMKDVSSITT